MCLCFELVLGLCCDDGLLVFVLVLLVVTVECRGFRGLILFDFVLCFVICSVWWDVFLL